MEALESSLMSCSLFVFNTNHRNMKFFIVFFTFLVSNFGILESYRYDRTVSICDRNVSPNSTFYRLPKTVTPIKYRIKFRSELNRYRFFGKELIQVMIHNRTDIIELNSLGLDIESAWFMTRRLRVEVKAIYSCPEKQTIILQFYKYLDRGQGNLTIHFNGNINSMVTGFYRYNQAVDDEQGMIAVTDFGPTDSRRAFPNWDEPAFKAMIELTLVTPRNHMVLTNMNEKRRREYNPYFDEIRFETSPPMTTGLMAIVVGKFDYIEKLTEDEEVLIRVFTPLGRRDEGNFALEVTSRLLMFYKFYFNCSYPLIKLDLISISDFPSSLETWGLITFTESQILVSNYTSDEEKRTVAVVIAHALAHQWLGNLVTFDSWNDMWISEGFATYIENEAIDIMFPNWKVWQNFVTNDYQNALELDTLMNANPIEIKVDFPSEINQKFNDISFQKSAAIMRMLSVWVGKQTFRDGVRHFLADNSYKSVKSSHFWKTFEEIKELEFTGLVDTWAKNKGYPVINVKERHSGKNRILTLSQEKFMIIEKPSNNSNYTWQIPIQTINQFSPFMSSAEIFMKTKEMEYEIKNVLEWEWVKLNQNSNGFFRVHYSSDMLDRFALSIADKSMPAMDRLNIVSDLFAMIQSGRVSTHIGLKYLLHYKNDDNSAVWNYILALMRKLDLLLSDTDLRENFWSFGREMLTRLGTKLGWDIKNKEDMRVTRLRPQIIELLAIFKDRKTIKEGFKRFENIRNGNVGNLTEEMIVIIYKIVGSNCDQETFDEFFELYKTAGNPVKRNHLITALISTSVKERILKVLDFSLSENIRFIDSTKIITGLCHSMLGRDKTWKHFEKHFIEYQRMFGSTSAGMNMLIKNFIEKFSSEDKANEFDTYFGSRFITGIDKSIETSIERIRITAKWLNRDIIQIREYLTKNYEKEVINIEFF